MRTRLPILIALGAALSPVAAADAAVVAPAVIDTAPLSATDIAVAPDGTGALVYTKKVNNQDRIYASFLENGAWGPPVRIDPDDGDSEDAPRVAVANGGRTLFGYRDGQAADLKWRLRPSAGEPLTAEEPMYQSGGTNRIGFDWDLDMNASGVAYAGFAAFNPGTMKRDARAWRLEGTTDVTSLRLQANPNTESIGDAGNGPDIRVAVTPSGTGALMFNQNDDKLLLRRLGGLSGVEGAVALVDVSVPSVLGENLSGVSHQLDLDIGGTGVAWATGSAMYPDGGHAVGVPVTDETAGEAAVLDGYPAPENDNVERPDVTLNSAGRGLYVSEPNQGAGIFGGTIDGASASPAMELNLLDADGAASEIPVAALGDGGRGMVAWTRDVPDGNMGPTEVRARVFDGSAFGGEELLLSDPALGQASIPFGVVSADGAGASRLGDTAVLMVQNDGTQRVAVGRYDAPPTAPTGTTSEAETAERRPVLAWTASEALWSPLASYKVFVDEQLVATLPAGQTTFTPAADLAPGQHSWRVVAVDTLGQETSSPARTLRIKASGGGGGGGGGTKDTTKPAASLKVSGSKKVGKRLKFTVKASDAGGGVASVKLSFGDGSKAITRTRAFTARHKFAKKGRFTVTLRVRDKAGNETKVRKTIRIKKR